MKAKTKTALAKELDAAHATIAEQQQLIAIWRKRLDHSDIEVAHARLSRDNHRDKLLMLLARMKEQGISIVIASTSIKESQP